MAMTDTDNDKRHMVMQIGTGETRPVTPEAPLLTSARSPWPGILLEHRSAGRELELHDVATCEHVVVVQLNDSSEFEWRENGRYRTVKFNPGESVLHPAGAPLSFRIARTSEVVAISLDPKFVRCAAHDLFAGSDRLELTQRVELSDPMLHGLAVSLKEEAEAGYPGGRSYGESLANSLAAHLVRRYSNAGPLAKPQRGGLPRHHLRRAIDFIHDRAAQDVSLASIAAEVGLSPFHFARQFKQATGLAPHQYLVQHRVERARELLLSENSTVADIAVRVGFCDQSHLTVHFKRVFGVTPAEFRNQMGVRRKTI